MRPPPFAQPRPCGDQKRRIFIRRGRRVGSSVQPPPFSGVCLSRGGSPLQRVRAARWSVFSPLWVSLPRSRGSPDWKMQSVGRPLSGQHRANSGRGSPRVGRTPGLFGPRPADVGPISWPRIGATSIHCGPPSAGKTFGGHDAPMWRRLRPSPIKVGPESARAGLHVGPISAKLRHRFRPRTCAEFDTRFGPTWAKFGPPQAPERCVTPEERGVLER